MALTADDIKNYKGNSLQIGNSAYNPDYLRSNPQAMQEALNSANNQGYTTHVNGVSSSYSPSSSSPSNPDMSGYINSLAGSQLASKASALQKARDNTVNGYNQQITELPGQYQPLRNQADLRGAQNSRAITEQMAAQGNWRSGANQTAQTANNASTANNIASYDLAQQQAVDKLKQAIAQANTDYGTNLAGVTADTESQKLSDLIAQANTDRTFNHQVSQDQFNNGINAAQVTGYTPNIVSSLYPAWNVPAKTYGLQGDVAANPGINLYIPGQTQLHQGDIFLGGTATGVTDEQLNGAQRIAGNTANDTAALYKNYLNSVGVGQANSLPSYIAQQYPGATDVTNNNGTYKFKDAAGNTVYYRG